MVTTSVEVAVEVVVVVSVSVSVTVADTVAIAVDTVVTSTVEVIVEHGVAASTQAQAALMIVDGSASRLESSVARASTEVGSGALLVTEPDAVLWTFELCLLLDLLLDLLEAEAVTLALLELTTEADLLGEETTPVLAEADMLGEDTRPVLAEADRLALRDLALHADLLG